MNKVFQEEERRIDLASIRKIDNNISHILDKTDNVAFYRFDGKAWVSLRFFYTHFRHIWNVGMSFAIF